jgi:hypothetical protein
MYEFIETATGWLVRWGPPATPVSPSQPPLSSAPDLPDDHPVPESPVRSEPGRYGADASVRFLSRST